MKKIYCKSTLSRNRKKIEKKVGLPHHFLVVVLLPLCRCFLLSNVEFFEIIYLIKFRQLVEKVKKKNELLDSNQHLIFLKKNPWNGGPNVLS